MTVICHLVALVALITRSTLAQNDGPYDVFNHFQSPKAAGFKVTTNPTVWSDNPVFTIGAKTPLRWVTNRATIRLTCTQYSTGMEWIVAGI